MKIKNIQELDEIREKLYKEVELRNNEGVFGDETQILIGMATCGIASGAIETMDAINDEIRKQHLENVKVIQVGCLGYCHSEPTVQINKPGSEPVIYGKVDAEMGRLLVKELLTDEHIINDSFMHEMMIQDSIMRTSYYGAQA